MDNPQRATVAFLCGCLSNKHSTSHNGIHDYAMGKYISLSYSNNGGNISIFDYTRGCSLNGRFPSFFDYGVAQYISLTRVGNSNYSVFDYNTSSYLSVTCNGNAVSVFDYAKGMYYNYNLN